MSVDSLKKIEELEGWVQSYGSPLYLYCLDNIESQISKLKTGVHSSVKMFYSVKANPNPSLVHHISKQGVGAEVCSEAELRVALLAGVDPQDIIFLGPGKQEHELSYALKIGVRYLIVESLQEAELLNQLCAEQGVHLTIGIRVNPQKAKGKARLIMGGLPRQFGIDEDQIDLFIRKTKELQYVTVAGIHMYVGTQNLDEESIIENSRYILSYAGRVSQQYNLKLRYVGIGGGMGLKYSDSEQDIDIERLQRGLAEEINHFQYRYGHVDILLESGRYLIGESGTYVCKVLYTKDSQGKRFVIVDGGIHHFSPTFMSPFTKFKDYLLQPYVKSERKEILQTITGSLCTPSDILSKQVCLPELYPGDLIAFKKAGAYGLTASPLLFLSHQLPQEIMIRGKQSVLIREKTEYMIPKLRKL